MRKIIASLIAGTLLLTGCVMAATAGTTSPTKVTATAKPASTAGHSQKHAAQKHGGQKPPAKTTKASAKAPKTETTAKAQKPSKKTGSK